MAPDNDNFTQAQTCTIVSFPISGDNTDATKQIGEPTSHYNSVWYSFTSPDTGKLNLAIGSGFSIAVYTGDQLNELNVITPLTGSGNNITIAISPVLEYKISVYSNTSLSYGPFTLSATFTQLDIPSNNNFDDAVTVSGDSFSESADNTLATIQLNEPTGNYFSVWYEYTPPSTGGLLTLSKTVGISLVFNVYFGDSLTGLVLVASGTDSLTFKTLYGSTYKIAVCSTSSSSFGTFTFTGSLLNEFALLQTVITDGTHPLQNTLVGVQGIVRESAGRIWVLDDRASQVAYSDDQGFTWTLDTSQTFDNSYTFWGLFLDENENLVTFKIENASTSQTPCIAYVRNKGDGTWETYTVDITNPAANGPSSSMAICQDSNYTFHIVKTTLNYLNSSYSTSNLYYFTFKDGVFSSDTKITYYSNFGTTYSDSALATAQDVPFVQAVIWNGQPYVFWAVRTLDNLGNETCVLKYTPLQSTSKIDIVAASRQWVTARAYVVGVVVSQSGSYYVCAQNHNSGTFATDLANGDWTLISSYTTPTTFITLTGGEEAKIRSVRATQDGNIYLTTQQQPSGIFKLYENFVDITQDSWGSSLYPWYVEVAENDDILVYGFDSGGGNSNAGVAARVGGVWTTFNSPTLTYGMAAAHTYNWAIIR